MPESAVLIRLYCRTPLSRAKIQHNSYLITHSHTSLCMRPLSVLSRSTKRSASSVLFCSFHSFVSSGLIFRSSSPSRFFPFISCCALLYNFTPTTNCFFDISQLFCLHLFLFQELCSTYGQKGLTNDYFLGNLCFTIKLPRRCLYLINEASQVLHK